MASAITACPLCGLEYAGGEVFCPNDGARLAAQSDSARDARRKSEQDPLIGTTLSDRYRIIRKIGEGGMGMVYEAEHVLIEKRVARGTPTGSSWASTWSSRHSTWCVPTTTRSA